MEEIVFGIEDRVIRVDAPYSVDADAIERALKSPIERFSMKTNLTEEARKKREEERAKRDTERELQLKAQVGHELPLEADLERWFPEGPEDESVVLIKVVAEHVDYWSKEGDGSLDL